MTLSKDIRLIGPTQRAYALERVSAAPLGWVVTIRDETRTQAQNRKLWPMLQDVAEQVEWHGLKLSKEEWKDMFTAGLRGCKVIPGLEGGFVTVGMSTSAMSKGLFADLVTYIYAFGDQKGVMWSEPKVGLNE